MNIDFTQPICTSHDRPLVGDYRGLRGNGDHIVGLPSLSQAKPGLTATRWFYGEDGTRPRENDPAFNLVNFDPKDGVRRIVLEDNA